MKEILKGIITSILLSQIIFLMIPFNIHADTTTNTAPFLGFNVQITGYGENMSSIQIPKINFSYAGNTVPSGYISGKLNCTSPSTPTSSAPCDIFSLTNNNGGYSDLQGLKVVFPLQSYLLDANGNAIINHQSYFFVDYEFILDDNYKGYVVITSSDNVSHTIYVNGNNFHYETFTQDPANPLTFTISNYDLTRVVNPIMWNLPIESLGYNYYLFERYEYEGFTDIDYYSYPMFTVKQNDSVFNYYSVTDKTLTLIFGLNETVSGKAQFENNFSFTGHTFQSGTTLYSYQLLDGSYFCIYKVILKASGNGSKEIKYIGNKTIKYIGIYAYRNDLDIPNISTEFALRYGLNNRQLKDLDLIANGTTQSNQSASDLQTSTNLMQDQMDDMVDIESGYNQQFNNSLNNIDFTNPIQNNAGILPAANFVITAFNGLVNNPLSILIIIICILTIGKKVIGK